MDEGLAAFVSMRTRTHDQEYVNHSLATRQATADRVESLRMSGGADCQLRVVVPGITTCHAVFLRLTAGRNPFDVSSSLAMEESKANKAPLNHVNR